MSLVFYPKSHRYKLDGEWVPGVTTLINKGLPKPALVKWAPKFVAQIVEEWRTGEWDESRDELHADLARAIRQGRFPEWLARTPDAYKTEKGAAGSEIHDIAERIIHGQDVDVPDRVLPYVQGYVEFLDRWDVRPIITEQSVGSREHRYAGRIDCIATVGALGGMTLGLDWKTSNNVYGSTALQIAAYVRADFTVTDDDPDTERPIPEVEGTAVAHITAEGTNLHWLGRDTQEVHEAFSDFLAVARVAARVPRIDGTWDRKLRKATGSYLSDPIDIEEARTA